jgi:integrase
MENPQGEIKKECLSLTRISEGLRSGIKKNGIKYTVRDDRRRYFFPGEWEKFMGQITNKEHRFFFLTLLHTGGRIMEVLNLKHENIDVERGTITFTMVKQRKANKNAYAIGKSRGFFVASNYIKEYKSFTRGKTINPKDYIFLNNLPENYESLNNKEKQKYFSSKKISYSAILKSKLKKVGIQDYYNFSPHNIRKTYGMWMRTFNKEMSELCYRMGHDIDTYMAHYGSSLIFNDEERRKIAQIFGDVK